MQAKILSTKHFEYFISGHCMKWMNQWMGWSSAPHFVGRLLDIQNVPDHGHGRVINASHSHNDH